MCRKRVSDGSGALPIFHLEAGTYSTTRRGTPKKIGSFQKKKYNAEKKFKFPNLKQSSILKRYCLAFLPID